MLSITIIKIIVKLIAHIFDLLKRCWFGVYVSYRLCCSVVVLGGEHNAYNTLQINTIVLLVFLLGPSSLSIFNAFFEYSVHTDVKLL